VTIVINLISQNLIGHSAIITQRCDRSEWPETHAPASGCQLKPSTTGPLQADTATRPTVRKTSTKHISPASWRNLGDHNWCDPSPNRSQPRRRGASELALYDSASSA
jgi:hypothetical protein